VRPLPDRRGVVLWGALAAAFLVAQQVTGKATRDALFLSHHPATSLPLVMMAAALVAVTSALAVSRLLAVRPPRQVVPALVGLHAALLLGEFLLALEAPRLAGILVYLQVAATGGTLLSGYWSVVNERFDPWTAKHVVRRLALGASVGGVAGGVTAFAVAGTVPMATMLLLTAGLNVVALVGIVRFGGDAPALPVPPASGILSPLGTLRSVPYLHLIALLVALGAATEALLDYVLKSRVSATLASGPEMMAFFAAFHTGMGLLAFAFQTLLARPALQSLGLAGTVALRPLAVAAAAAVGLVDLRLWSAVLGRGSHDVLSNSLFRSAYELLYTALPDREKRTTKQLVDVGFEKLGALLGGAATLAAVRSFDAPERALLFLAGGLSLLTLGLTGRLHRGYVATLEEGLRAGKVRLDPEEVVDSTTRLTLAETHLPHSRPAAVRGVSSPAPPEALAPGSLAPASDPLLRRIADLRSGDAERIRRVLRQSDGLEVALVPHLMSLVGRNDVYLDVLRALRKLAPQSTGQILDTLLDSGADPVVRRRLPRVLKASPSPRALEGLIHGIADPLFVVRASCAGALAAFAARSPDLRVPADVAFAAVHRDLEGALAPQTDGTAAMPDREALLEHVFRLLSLALDREPLRIAAWALRGSDTALRGTALEYLENVLPHEVRAVFLRFLGASEMDRGRPREEVLTDLMRSSGGLTSQDRLRRRGLRPRR